MKNTNVDSCNSIVPTSVVHTRARMSLENPVEVLDS